MFKNIYLSWVILFCLPRNFMHRRDMVKGVYIFSRITTMKVQYKAYLLIVCYSHAHLGFL